MAKRFDDYRKEIDNEGNTCFYIDFYFKNPDNTFERIREKQTNKSDKEVKDRVKEIRKALTLGLWKSSKQHKAEKAIEDTKAWNAFCDKFIALHIAKIYKPSSRKQMTLIVDKRLRQCFAGKSVEGIGKLEICEMLADLEQQGYAPNTIKATYATLMLMLRKAFDWDYIKIVPVLPRSDKPKVPKGKNNMFTINEINKIIEVADNETYKGMFLCAISTGLRLGEILALRWSDIDLKGKVIAVNTSTWEGIVSTPKSNEARYIPLSKRFADYLEGRRGSRSSLYVFPNTKGQPQSHRHAEVVLHRYAAKAGIDLPAGKAWHAIRHLYASTLAEQGVPVSAIQKLLGHSDLTTTQIYLHISDDAVKASSAAIDQALEGCHGQITGNVLPFAAVKS